MKNARLITTAAVILTGFVPASVALASNGADDAVRQASAPAAKVVTVARTADDNHHNRHRGRGRDDNGRHGVHHRRGHRVEAGDDNGGRRVRGNRVEAGDDNGGLRARDDRVEAGDDHGGRGHGSDDA